MSPTEQRGLPMLRSFQTAYFDQRDSIALRQRERRRPVILPLPQSRTESSFESLVVPQLWLKKRLQPNSRLESQPLDNLPPAQLGIDRASAVAHPSRAIRSGLRHLPPSPVQAGTDQCGLPASYLLRSWQLQPQFLFDTVRQSCANSTDDLVERVRGFTGLLGE